MIEEGIYRFLTSDGNVSALIGTRAYEQSLPESPSLPLVVFWTVTEMPLDSLDGENILKTRRIQFDCYANKARDARQLQGKVRAALEAIALGATFQESSVILSTRILLGGDKGIEPGAGGTLFCSYVEVELSFIPSN